jgi:hypothetical protein
MSYTIKNKSTTFITIVVRGEPRTLGCGTSLSGVHDKNITPVIRSMARRGVVDLIYERPVNKPGKAPVRTTKKEPVEKKKIEKTNSKRRQENGL